MSSLSCPNCNALYSVSPKSSKVNLCKPCYKIAEKTRYDKMIESNRKGIADGTITKATCKRCDTEKLVSEFTVRLQYCKDCSSLMQKACRDKEENVKKREEKLQELKAKPRLQCKGCKKEKNQDEFSGRNIYCKVCTQERNIAHYQANCEERKQKQKEYTKRRKEAKIKPEITEKSCSKCKAVKSVDEFSFSYGNGYQPACNECRKIEAKEYRDKNKEEIQARARARNKIKPRTLNGLLAKLRKYACKWALGIEGSKSRAAKDFLGCNVDLFAEWIQYNCNLEKLDYNVLDGSWHVDHVVACSLFDWDNKEEESSSCFHWTNMVPISKDKNLSKQNYIIFSQVQEVKQRLHDFMKLKSFTQEDIDKNMIHWTTIYQDIINARPKNKTRENF